MKGTDKIISHIEADAKRQAEAIIKAAEEKCSEITARYEEKASKLYSEKIRNGVKECQEKEDGALRIARMEAKKSLLSVKQEMVEKSFIEAEKALAALPEDEYIAFLTRLVLEASRNGGEEIVLNQRDRDAIGKKLLENVNKDGGSFTLSNDCGDFSGGLILRRKNIETNCSIELLVNLCKGDLSSKLAEVLFR